METLVDNNINGSKEQREQLQPMTRNSKQQSVASKYQRHSPQQWECLDVSCSPRSRRSGRNIKTHSAVKVLLPLLPTDD